MLGFIELEKRWDIFKKFRNELNIIQIMLLFSQHKISPDWTEEESLRNLQDVVEWKLPDPKNNLKHNKLLVQIFDILIQINDRNENVKKISFKNFWVEQWCVQLLEFNLLKTSHFQIISQILKDRRFLQGSEQILLSLFKQQESTHLLEIIVHYYTAHENYTQAIFFQKRKIKRTERLSVEQSLKEKIEFLNLLLLRNGQYTYNVTDAELAYSLLHQIFDETHNDYQHYYNKVRHTLIYRSSLCDVKVENIDKIIGSIKRFNFNTAEKTGGTVDLPYYPDLIRIAPLAITQIEFERYFKVHHHLSKTFNKVLDQKNFNENFLQASSLSAFMLWNYSQIEPEVLDALSFSSATHTTIFSDLQDVGKDLSQGAITRLSGYVAEQQVALNLQSQGYHVEFPETSNQQGFDLLVDGHPVQVKCTLSASYVQEHLNHNPDIPVIINKELADSFADNPMVWVDKDLSHSVVQQVTNDSLEHLEQFNSSAELLVAPFITLILSSKRHYDLYQNGNYQIQDVVKQTFLDSSIRMSGVVAGKMIGGGIGILGGPLGAIVGVSAGAYLGNILATSASDQLLKPHVVLQAKKVSQLLKEFAIWFTKGVIPNRMDIFSQQKQESTQPKLDIYQQINDQDILLLHFNFLHREKLKRLQKFHQYLEALLATSQAHAIQAGWICVENVDQFYHPQLRVRLAEINEALKLYQEYALQPLNFQNSENSLTQFNSVK